MKSTKIKTRIAKPHDAAVVADIYNQAIAAGLKTADITTVSIENRVEWLKEHDDKRYPVVVAEVNGEIIGYGSISPYRKGREALNNTAEISYYVHNSFMRRGVGSKIMEEIINFSANVGIKNLFAIVISDNASSIAILEKFNFKKWGVMPGVVEFQHKEYDHLCYGLKL